MATAPTVPDFPKWNFELNDTDEILIKDNARNAALKKFGENLKVMTDSINADLEVISGAYYGALAEDPTQDPNGQPMEAGDRYFNTTLNVEKSFNGTEWQANEVSAHLAESDPHTQYEFRVKHNTTATRAPAINDDSGAGYGPRSTWFDTSATPPEAYRCINATTGAAKWVKTSLTLDELGSAATANAGDFDPAGAATQAVTAHVDKLDPHTQYLRRGVAETAAAGFHVNGKKLYWGTGKQHNLFDNDGFGNSGVQLNMDGNALVEAGASFELELEESTGVFKLQLYALGEAGSPAVPVQSLTGGIDGTLTWNGHTIWHSNNDGTNSGLDADTVRGLVMGSIATRGVGEFLQRNVSQTTPGTKFISGSPPAIANIKLNDKEGETPLEIGNAGNTGASAVMAFHRSGTSGHAVFFGLDTDNKMKIGGWSLGEVAYEIVTDQNFAAKLAEINITKVGVTAFLKNKSGATLSADQVVPGSSLVRSSTGLNEGVFETGSWRCHGSCDIEHATSFQRIA